MISKNLLTRPFPKTDWNLWEIYTSQEQAKMNKE